MNSGIGRTKIVSATALGKIDHLEPAPLPAHNTFCMERYADSHQHRFDEQIYRHYVEKGIQNEFKPVTKKQFKKLILPPADRCRTFFFDTDNIYRLADSKEVWFLRNGQEIGHVWKEQSKESETGYIRNYWVNIKFIKL